MLDIPEEVKQLFRQSSTKKNIRIHFPNGEREDITNSNLISESFSFTESICSQDTLKFGLCEASMVEFETFGVGNIKDCTIEVTLEVPYNGEAYPIPIGTFVVDSCEKQANLGRRNVVAYSKDFDFGKISQFEKAKRVYMADPYYNENGYYEYDLLKFIASNYYSGKENFLKIQQLELTERETYTGIGGVSKGPERIILQLYTSRKMYCINTEKQHKALYLLNGAYRKKEINEVFNNIVNRALKKLAEYAEAGEKTVDYINTTLREYCERHIRYNTYPRIENVGGLGITITDNNNLIYPYPYLEKYVKDGIYIQIPYVLGYEIYKFDTVNHERIILETESTIFLENPEIYLVDTSTWSQYTNVEKGDFVNKLPNTRELTESYFELNGLLGKIGREGAVDLISLKPKLGLYPSETLYPAENLYPRGMDNLLTKAMYKHPVWYDDTYTLPYSKVICTYKNSETNENTIAEYDIVEVEEGEESNYQTYDLSDNYLIKNNTFTEAEITAILETFASNVEGVKYMPAEINTVGAFPYLEAGDVVQVITTDGGFETIILNRTLSGIQSLSDSYESRG